MSNFKNDILEAANGEPIECIVIGEYGWGGYKGEERDFDDSKKGVLLTWEEAVLLLDYEYDTGFGAPECHAIEAFTASRILHVSEYDGSTYVAWSNRNPVACMPGMTGG